MKFYAFFAIIVVLFVATLIAMRTPKEQAPKSEFENVFELTPDQYVSDAGWSYLQDQQGNINQGVVLLPRNPSAEIDPTVATDQFSDGYIGTHACGECHQENYKTFVETSHFKTSAEANRETVFGSFEPGRNELVTKSRQLVFEMLAADDTLIQRVKQKQKQKRNPQAVAEIPFGLVTGSGKLGQTYLHWNEDFLYQQHVSYMTSLDAWINSPGLEDGTAVYARPVGAECLECHATYFQTVEGTRNKYRKDNYLLGVGCEKCHGRGRAHAEFHRDNPDSKDAHAIINPSALSQELALDTCQLCHGGTPVKNKQKPFSYQPGQPISDYFEFEQVDQGDSGGIHSNTQLPRLLKSKCFQKSDGMTCATCHNPHRYERDDLKLFSTRCIECHAVEDCGKFESIGAAIKNNCIDCHMPGRSVADIKGTGGEGIDAAKMRDHWIKVWPEGTDESLELLPK